MLAASFLVQLQHPRPARSGNPEVWPGNARAAITFSYDDTRDTSWMTAAPQLEDFGFRGTFNLNTWRITDWEPWRRLHRYGHELASHTFSHARLPELSDEQIRAELERAIRDLTENIQFLGEVPSFTYPFGDSDARVQGIVGEYHKTARGAWGLNESCLPDPLLLKGKSFVPPWDLDEMKWYVDYNLERGGWMLLYFHGVGYHPNALPRDMHRELIRYVAEKGDDIWVATQGEVAEWMLGHDDVTPVRRTTWGRIKLLYP